MKRVPAALLLLVLAAPALGQDFKKGVEAYEQGDYATALREWRPLPEHGHAAAQVKFGEMYRSGLGVPQDYAEAVKRYHKAAEQATVCTDKDREYSSYIGSGGADEAYKFGLRIQESVERRDIHSLFGLVVGELGHGPRKKSVRGKSFSEIFTDEWRKAVLSGKPDCSPVGWRGYMLSHGSIWYKKRNDVWSIVTINGAREIESSKTPLDGSWKYNGELLTSDCFTTMWISADNYEDYFKFLENQDVDFWSEFYANIGRYIGSHIPLDASSEYSGGKKEFLTPKLSQCSLQDGPPYIEITDGWVVTKNYEARDCSSERCLDAGYRVLKRISLKHCRLLVAYYAETCLDIRLVEIFEESGGSMGPQTDIGLYGIIKDPSSGNTYVVPLVNFDNANNALNYVDDLD